MQRDRILAEPDPPPRRMWLTTADAALLLDVTTRWVRWLARAGELPCEVTQSGQRMFRRGDVERALIQRATVQARSRPQMLRAVRVQMLKAGYEPRQMSFLRHLKLVRSGDRDSERAVPQAEVKAARSFDERRGSDTSHYVNRKIAGGRR